MNERVVVGLLPLAARVGSDRSHHHIQHGDAYTAAGGFTLQQVLASPAGEQRYCAEHFPVARRQPRTYYAHIRLHNDS